MELSSDEEEEDEDEMAGEIAAYKKRREDEERAKKEAMEKEQERLALEQQESEKKKESAKKQREERDREERKQKEEKDRKEKEERERKERDERERKEKEERDRKLQEESKSTNSKRLSTSSTNKDKDSSGSSFTSFFKSKDKEDKSKTIAELESALQIAQKQRNQESSRVRELDNQIVEMQEELNRQYEKITALEKELLSHDGNTKEILDHAGAEWANKVANLEMDLSAAKERLRSQEAEYEHTLKERLEQQAEEHTRSVTLYTAEISQLKSEVEQFKARQQAFDHVNSTWFKKVDDKLKSQVTYYEQQLVEADETIDNIRVTYQSTNSVLMEEVKTLEISLAESRRQENELRLENKELNHKVDILDSQVKKHAESRVRMSEVMNQIEVQLSEKDEKLGHVLAENDDLRMEIAKLKKHVQRLQQQY